MPNDEPITIAESVKAVPFPGTLRDWFAGMALQALAIEYFKFNGACFDKDHLYQNVSAHAFRMADAMLKARKDG